MADQAITQLWDYRLLYVYALFGGYVSWGEEAISKAVIDFLNENENLKECEAFLSVLERSDLIYPKDLEIKEIVRDIEGVDTGEVVVSDQPQRQVSSKGEIEVLDKQWFRNKVHAYLEAFRNGMIFYPYNTNHQSYVKQKREILEQLADTEQHQKVEGSQQFGQNAEPMQFLETLFSMVDEGLVEVSFIKPVLYNSRPAVKRWGFDATMFEAKAKLKVAKKSLPKNVPATQTSVTAEAKIDGTQIYIGVQGEDLIPLWRVRTDSGPYNFMHYIQAHTNQNIGIGDITSLDGCASYKDMTEVVRNLHFDKQLKKIFFDGTTRKVVRFTSTKELGLVESRNYKSLLLRIAKQS